MIPASHAATSRPPQRGATATTMPATISTTPIISMASCALPGMRSFTHVGEVGLPVVGEHPEELVQPEQDRRQREAGAQQQEGPVLGRGRGEGRAVVGGGGHGSSNSKK